MKSKYEIVEANWEKIRESREKGQTDKSIYSALGLSKAVWEKYKVDHLDFQDMLKISGQCAVRLVESALFLAATGQQKITKTKKYSITLEDGTVLDKEETVTEELPINMTAVIFYLSNRASAQWQARPAENFISQNKAKLERAIAELQYAKKFGDINFDLTVIDDEDKSKKK